MMQPDTRYINHLSAGSLWSSSWRNWREHVTIPLVELWVLDPGRIRADLKIR